MNLVELLKLEEVVVSAARSCLKKEGFTEAWPPHITAVTGACENPYTLFEVGVNGDLKWYGRRAFLAQTAQLYLETLVPKVGGVFTIGPSFRAEPRVDSRHLTEFTMIEIEFPGDFEALIQHIERVINAIKEAVIRIGPEIGVPEETLKELSRWPKVFPRITYDKAIELLQDKGEQISWGDDIDSKQEQMIVAHFDGWPVFITLYPDPMWDHGKEIEVEKFFNMLPDPENPGRVFSSDLIFPYGGEAVGAAMRVHVYKEILRRLINSRMFHRLQRKRITLKDFSWYLDNIKEKGSVPHSGCGFGVPRIMQSITKRPIQESVVFCNQQDRLR